MDGSAPLASDPLRHKSKRLAWVYGSNKVSLSQTVLSGPNRLKLLFVARETFSHCESPTSLRARTTLTQCDADPGHLGYSLRSCSRPCGAPPLGVLTFAVAFGTNLQGRFRPGCPTSDYMLRLLHGRRVLQPLQQLAQHLLGMLK